jgi:hypothetical protein
MPVVFFALGARFHFFSVDLAEPMHIHVSQRGRDAKFWLREDVVLAYNRGWKEREVSRFVAVIRERRCEIEALWNERP